MTELNEAFKMISTSHHKLGCNKCLEEMGAKYMVSTMYRCPRHTIKTKRNVRNNNLVYDDSCNICLEEQGKTYRVYNNHRCFRHSDNK